MPLGRWISRTCAQTLVHGNLSTAPRGLWRWNGTHPLSPRTPCLPPAHAWLRGCPCWSWADPLVLHCIPCLRRAEHTGMKNHKSHAGLTALRSPQPQSNTDEPVTVPRAWASLPRLAQKSSAVPTSSSASDEQVLIHQSLGNQHFSSWEWEHGSLGDISTLTTLF